MPEDIRILYSDASLVCCVKDPGTLSEDPGLPALIRSSLGVSGVFCVHRLDRETGGVMVYALNRDAAAALSRSFSPEGEAEKIYLSAVGGTLDEKSGTLTDLLFRDSRSNKSYVVNRPRRGVKEAALSYRVIAESGGRSLVAVRLHSGRTHQIRVQFASRKHPVLGDRRYGSDVSCPLALWACRLSFRHPVTGEIMSFSCPPPAGVPWDDWPETADICDNQLLIF